MIMISARRRATGTASAFRRSFAFLEWHSWLESGHRTVALVSDSVAPGRRKVSNGAYPFCAPSRRGQPAVPDAMAPTTLAPTSRRRGWWWEHGCTWPPSLHACARRESRRAADQGPLHVRSGERGREVVLNGLYASPEAGEKVCIGLSVCNGRL